VSERDDTMPGTPVNQPYGSGGGSTAYPGPAAQQYPPGYAPQGDPSVATAPEYSTRPVAYRRPDILAGLLLILAGIAAAISLVLHWVKGSKATGLDLVREGFRSLSHLVSTGFWQPLVIVLGGGVLFLLGVFTLLPARSHRFLGLLGLLVTLAVLAGLLVPLADSHWSFHLFDIGFWFACAVGVLGLLGSLKALATRGRVS
jgi:hypothetical protein